MTDIEKEKLNEFYRNPANKNVQKYIVGYNSSTNKVILKNEVGNVNEVSVDDLKNFDFSTFTLKKENSDIEMIEEIEDFVPLNKPSNESKKNYTLLDLKNAVSAKNIELVDNILATFAVNPQNGMINLDLAISIVNDNTTKRSIECINEHKNFSTNLSDYFVNGQIINENNIQTNQTMDDILNAGFNNILVFVDVAKLKGIVYSEEKIARAKVLYTTSVRDGLNLKKLESNSNVSSNKLDDNKMNLEESKNEIVERKSYVPALRPDHRKAGFADIFILSIIILVYAAIIVNLIIKLK